MNVLQLWIFEGIRVASVQQSALTANTACQWEKVATNVHGAIDNWINTLYIRRPRGCGKDMRISPLSGFIVAEADP
jgi:hypothetical protein